MKKSLFAVASLLMASFASWAQTDYSSSNGAIDRIRIEGSYGYNLAISPTDNIETKDYNGFKTLQLGVRIDIDGVWGVRGTYMNTTFQNKNVSSLGMSENKFVAEATYQFFPNAIKPSFQLLGHAGFGAGFIKSKNTSGTDMVGVVQLGLMPEYNMTSQFSFFADLTYIMNLSQNYGFDGLTIDKSSASIFVPSIGISYKFTK